MALPTKEQLLAIIGAYGLGRVLPRGSTRAATVMAVNGMVKAGRVVVPAAGRAAAPVGAAAVRGGAALVRRNPYVAAGLAGYGAYEAGLLDPFIEPAQELVQEEVVIPLKKSGKRSRSKFNKAVSTGMKAVRSSSFYGKKGQINNAKRAFSAVTKTASKINRGKKVSTKGVTGTIARAVRRIL
tara:strand:- start:441 stop:989 length:549 start_codon:yes stop_codon:yes gene_type:complete